MPHLGSSSSSSPSPSEHEPNDEQEQVIVARALASLHQSEDNKQSPQTSDRQHNSRRRPTVVRRNMNPGSDYSYYPMPCHSWTYPSFNPNAVVYHMWQQSQASLQQNHHLLTLPPPHPTDPRFLPLRSMIQPAQGQFYSGIVQDRISPMPCFPQSTVLPTYFSDYPSSATARSRSQVTIQEINEEKNQLEEKDWLCGSNPDTTAKPTTPKTINRQSDASPASEVCSDRETDIALTRFNPVPSGSDAPIAKDSCGSTKIQEKQVDGSPRKPFEWVPGSSIWPRPTSPCRAQNPHPSEPARSGPGVHHHPTTAVSARSRGFRPPQMSVPVRSGFRPRSSSMAAPVTIRTAIPVCSARPSTVNYMAPAVHVRTVVPVCSAPVRAPDSTQKSGQDTEGSRVGVSSEFVKL